MKIVWDESKRLTNLAKHGLDFADLDFDFFAAAAAGPQTTAALLQLANGPGSRSQWSSDLLAPRLSLSFPCGPRAERSEDDDVEKILGEAPSDG
jgi:hypothetical protein